MELEEVELRKFLLDKGICCDGLYILDSIDSTNLEAFRLLESTKKEVVVVLAKRQTAGRGTHGRKWESNESGNLILSIGFNRVIEPNALREMGLSLNILGCKRLCSLFNKQFEVKWPNDILFNNKKLAGMLTESKIANGVANQWVVGFGLNVNNSQQSWSDEVKGRAITLKEILGEAVDINFLASELIECFINA